ncbi:MAG: DUF2867 domain-containing protein [Salinivirgaceae bacterium]|nr:DUF2867 domain-containing protein [Salinivirgaceae bacterium]
MDTIDYFDSYMIKKESNCSIDEITSKILTLPSWIKILLKIRHYLVVKPFGLSSGKRKVPILYRNKNEIVIGENDKHLYYRVSLYKKTGQHSEIYLTTSVKFNNKWGKVYFAFIKPFHKMVVKSMLKKV